MPILPKNKKRYLSFLFSDKLLRIGKIDPSGKKLENLFEFPLPENTLLNGEIVNPEQFINFLEGVKNQIKFTSSEITIGLSESRCYTYSLILPAIENKDIDQAIEYKADTFLPYPYNSEYLDWKIIETLPDGRKKILLSAIPKSLIDNYVSCFAKIGLYPQSFITTSLLLFASLPNEAKKLCFAACVENGSLALILCQNNSIQSVSVLSDLNELISTINHMNDFYLVSRGINNLPKQIYLCGENIPENLLNQLKNAQIESIIMSPQVSGIPQEKASEFVTLMALCQGEINLPEDEKTINILPKDLVNKYKHGQTTRSEVSLAIIILTIFGILNFFLIVETYLMFNKLNSLKKEIVFSTSELKKVDNFKAYKPKFLALKKIAVKKPKILSLIELLQNSKEVSIDIISYSQEKKEAYLSGTATTRNDLLKFKESLENKKIYTKVTLPLSALEKESNIQFRILIIL